MQDLIIIGGGPAGLSAATNAAAEGLSVTLLERDVVLGGQAGTSSRIENYLGFPNGVSGADLTRAAEDQASRLGANLLTDRQVVSLDFNEATGFWLTACRKGDKFVSAAVMLAVGVDYRRLKVEGGQSGIVMYGAPAEAHHECKDKDVIVVGGGNSAGQAALNLAAVGARVRMLVRRPLKQTMSRYLIERIAVDSRIVAEIGEIESVCTAEQRVTTKDGRVLPAFRVFAYIGSEPRTDFIQHCCTVDEKGFIETDGDFSANQAGMFVAGDVRADSRKRVAAAAGEGAIAAAAVWRFVYGA